MTNETVLQVSNVVKKIGKRVIVDNVSFQLKPGEIVGLLGHNGAGKTTIMKMIVGLSKVDGGKISTLKNEYVNSIIETPCFYKELTGYKNLELTARMYGEIDRERLNFLVKTFKLESAINLKVGKYSLGMKQRLAFAQCLYNKPKLLILDEPTNGLDPEGIIEFRNIMKALAKEEKVAILISSHIISEMQNMCDNFVFIKNGKCIKELRKNINATEKDIEEKYMEVMKGVS